ncbi:MAG TPA: hypothetical protein VG962_05605 [Steroidobacteraceae bacterium]|nr:hypothetical protein [Steroidobacteraceae bacterium]
MLQNNQPGITLIGTKLPRTPGEGDRTFHTMHIDACDISAHVRPDQLEQLTFIQQINGEFLLGGGTLRVGTKQQFGQILVCFQSHGVIAGNRIANIAVNNKMLRFRFNPFFGIGTERQQAEYNYY